MKPVTAFQTSDGELFTEQASAENHQKEINLEAKVRQWVQQHFCTNMFEGEQVGIIIENRDELLEALK